MSTCWPLVLDLVFVRFSDKVQSSDTFIGMTELTIGIKSPSTNAWIVALAVGIGGMLTPVAGVKILWKMYERDGTDKM